MCMSCGCGEVDVRHKPGDITRQDLEAAAANHGLDVQQVADNIQESTQLLRESGRIT